MAVPSQFLSSYIDDYMKDIVLNILKMFACLLKGDPGAFGHPGIPGLPGFPGAKGKLNVGVGVHEKQNKNNKVHLVEFLALTLQPFKICAR